MYLSSNQSNIQFPLVQVPNPPAFGANSPRIRSHELVMARRFTSPNSEREIG